MITGLWATSEGETFSHSGAHYPIDESPALPKPVQRPGPPIVIGGFGPSRTPRLAARYASEVNVAFAPPEAFPEITARVHAACEAIGRDPASLPTRIANPVVCGSDDTEVERRAANIGRDAATARVAHIAGTPAEVIDRIGEYRDAGAQTV